MLERIQKVFRDYKEDQTINLTVDSTFEEIGLDSLDIVEVVMNLEEEFDVTIELNGEIKTVGDLIRVIEAQ